MRRIAPLLLATFALVGVLLPTAWAEVLVNAVVAEVKGRDITLHQVLEAAALPLAQIGQRYSGTELEQRVATLLTLQTWELVHGALLVDEAEKQLTEMEKQQAQLTVDRIIKDMIGAAGSLVNLKERLDQIGLTVEEEKRRQTDKQMVQMLLEREVRSLVRVRAEEVRQHYLEHREEYFQPKKVRIRQILIRYDNYESKEEARRTADQVLEKLRAGGDFARLAGIYSHGPYAHEGGLWELMERGQFIEAVDEVAFSLPLGGLSDVLEGPVGYHIIRVEEVVPARTVPFEEAQTDIYKMLYQERYGEREKRYLDSLQEGALINVREQYLKTAVEQIVSAGPAAPVLTPVRGEER